MCSVFFVIGLVYDYHVPFALPNCTLKQRAVLYVIIQICRHSFYFTFLSWCSMLVSSESFILIRHGHSRTKAGRTFLAARVIG